MHIRLCSIPAPVDFVLIDRSQAGEVLITCRAGMPASDMVAAIRDGLSIDERDALRAQHGFPSVAAMENIVGLLPPLVQETAA